MDSSTEQTEQSDYLVIDKDPEFLRCTHRSLKFTVKEFKSSNLKFYPSLSRERQHEIFLLLMRDDVRLLEFETGETNDDYKYPTLKTKFESSVDNEYITIDWKLDLYADD